ncbi:endonuclease/exonuclease/phosphatase family protein [Jannaschia sp. Os4]|uniref:endonuclease/exonuclease/phosphatase family protein n=1 Tax=Jannaschia sp. Os4 TaxID=2807617 RepID=UPI0031B576DA
MLRVLGGLGAHVVALQEADLRLGDRPAALPHALLERAGWRVVPAGTGGSLGRHGNAVLLAPGVDVVGWEGIDLPGLELRGAVLAHLRAGGRDLAVAATHLGLRRRDRRAQATALMRRMEGSGAVLVAGDLNEWSARRGLEPLDEGLDLVSPGRSFHAARPIAALDRIGLGGGLALRGGGVGRSPEARRASDHLPVWVDLDWPPRTGPGHVENRTGTSLSRISAPVVAPTKKS